MNDREFWLERIAVVKVQIAAYEDALTAFATGGGVQSYTLDTGQSRQTVTRADLSSLRITLDSLYNRLATLNARVYGSAAQGRPAW